MGRVQRFLGLLLAITWAAAGNGSVQTSADAYTRYELLAPESESFRIVYDVTATAAGARHYFNPSLDGEELLWDRSFGRAHNTVVLPAGWYLTASSVPAVVDETAEGEIRLHFENDRPGVIEVFIRAARR